MDIERLKELREEVFEDYKAYMVKNLKDEDGKVYPSTVPLDECSPIGKDLAALIDAEIDRQSVTDEAVQRAIEWAEQERKDNFRYMMFGDADSATLAIDALRQMNIKKPCEICANFKRVDCKADWLEFTAVYCPNCGGKLVK